MADKKDDRNPSPIFTFSKPVLQEKEKRLTRMGLLKRSMLTSENDLPNSSTNETSTRETKSSVLNLDIGKKGKKTNAQKKLFKELWNKGDWKEIGSDFIQKVLDKYKERQIPKRKQPDQIFYERKLLKWTAEVPRCNWCAHLFFGPPCPCEPKLARIALAVERELLAIASFVYAFGYEDTEEKD